MVTTKRIAELAGVSRGTVDRALNNKSGINSGTKERILKIAEELQYVPNIAAKTLVNKGKSFKIGCILMKDDNPFIEEVQRGIVKKNKEYSEYGMELLIRHTPFEVDHICALLDELMQEPIDGLILQPVEDERLVQRLSALDIPIVLTNTSLSNFEPLCYVGSDFYQGGRIAANLMELITGRSCRIGIVSGFQTAASHRDRVVGFEDYIRECPGMSVIDRVECHDSDILASELTENMLRVHPEIDALFIVAGGVYGACMAARSLKKDMRVICFDNIDSTKKLVEQNVIQAAVCQNPVYQGELSLKVLYEYLVKHIEPKDRNIHIDLQVKIKSNISA